VFSVSFLWCKKNEQTILTGLPFQKLFPAGNMLKEMHLKGEMVAHYSIKINNMCPEFEIFQFHLPFCGTLPFNPYLCAKFKSSS
jgi:hypothetical protein